VPDLPQAAEPMMRPVQVGDLFAQTWGYGGAQTSYYRVVRRLGRYVRVQQATSPVGETRGPTSDLVPYHVDDDPRAWLQLNPVAFAQQVLPTT
jgi:hypothetical protein